MIVRWQGKIQPGRKSDFLWYFPDVLPTLAEIAHIIPPGKIDGISIVPTLLETKQNGNRQKKHEYLYWEFNGQTAIRIGNWKGLKKSKDEPFELYDLDNDIEEKNNVAENHPDIIARMKKYVAEAHENNVTGYWLDKSKRFKGHREK